MSTGIFIGPILAFGAAAAVAVPIAGAVVALQMVLSLERVPCLPQCAERTIGEN